MQIKLTIAVYIGLSVAAIGGYHLKQKYDMQNAISEKRALVIVDLKDPSSVQFRNERMSKSEWLCGEINSKNSYGAYTGFKRFIAFDSNDAYLEDIGSVGTGESRFYKDRMGSNRLRKIAREIEILNYRNTNGTAPPFGSLTDEDFHRELFEEQWKSICS